MVGSLADAPQADTLLIGIAPPGGKIPPHWRPIVLEAIARGLNVVSGLHEFLNDDAEFRAAAAQHGVRLVDLRDNDEHDVASGEAFRKGCLRIHTVANDCSCGKMVAAVEVAEGLRRAGIDAAFVATGQTGIMVAGSGCAVDRVISDFVSGAAEKLVLANQHHEVVVVEGQGSLFHPRYSGVTLGLLHGLMPDGLIVCYEMGRKVVFGMEQVPLRRLPEGDRFLRSGRPTHASLPRDRRGRQRAEVLRRGSGRRMRAGRERVGPAVVRRDPPRAGQTGRSGARLETSTGRTLECLTEIVVHEAWLL